MKLFELDDRAIALFDCNNAVVFVSGQWRPASIHTTRSALTDGTQLTIDEFRAQFPAAFTSLARLDIPDPDNRPN